MSTTFQIHGNRIRRDGNEVRLRGINLGNWLNLEDFMMGLPGTDWQIRHAFQEQFGAEFSGRFFSSFEKNFITEEDICFLAARNFNLVRIPLNYRRFEDDCNPGIYREDGFRPLDRLMEWCKNSGIAVLLDLHAVQGGQNTTPPSDNTTGYALLWVVKDFQDRCIALWEALAERYRDHPALFGYNLLNEPITNQDSYLPVAAQTQAMNSLCRKICAAIRKIDPLAPIVMEGNVRPSGGIKTLDADLFADPNTLATYHSYPLFNSSILPGLNAGTEEGLCGEGMEPGALETSLRESIQEEVAYAAKINRPMLLGEFGLFNPSSPAFAEFSSLPDVALQERVVRAQVAVNEEAGIHWALWSYTDVSLMGLLTPEADTPWRRFVERSDLLATRHSAEQERRLAFERINSLFEKDSGSALVFDAAWNDSIRGKNRAELRWMIKQLSTYPPDEILRMPESFHFRNCRLSDSHWRVLYPFMQ